MRLSPAGLRSPSLATNSKPGNAPATAPPLARPWAASLPRSSWLNPYLHVRYPSVTNLLDEHIRLTSGDKYGTR